MKLSDSNRHLVRLEQHGFLQAEMERRAVESAIFERVRFARADATNEKRTTGNKMNEGMVLKIEWHKQGRREYIAIPDGMRLSAQPMAHDPAFATVTATGEGVKVVDPFDEMVPIESAAASKYGIIEAWSFCLMLMPEGGDRIARNIGRLTTRAHFEERAGECRDKCAYEMRWDCGAAYLMHAGRTIDVFK